MEKEKPFLQPFKKEMREYLVKNQGMSYSAIADALNDSKCPTRRGGLWTANQVFKISKRNKL